MLFNLPGFPFATAPTTNANGLLLFNFSTYSFNFTDLPLVDVPIINVFNGIWSVTGFLITFKRVVLVFTALILRFFKS